MLQNKMKRVLIPKQFLFRLTFLNIMVITAFIGLSSWAIYNTACLLADGLVSMNNQKQAQFEATLFQYLWIFSISTIIIGSLTHFYLTKRLIHPLRELIDSTKKMKLGEYPAPIQVKQEGEIAELINHFNDLVKQIEGNEQHREKLVSDLSHEFRTPLSNLNGYLRALQNGVIKGDEKLYESLYLESKRLVHLVEQMEQLKEWDHVSTQTFSEKMPVNINNLVEQSVEIFRLALEEANINVHVEVEAKVIMVNRGAITQVISNLIDNAIRYYDGTGLITIKGGSHQTEYELSVTGPGRPISQDDQKRIFERLYRIDHSRSRELGGSGLGLAISKEIIEHHHGTIGMNTVGNVHTFWFKLPWGVGLNRE
ncbi:two-component system sensor histidine kinase BaeS [Cytobacillus eiseniae]|uniref:histidine kinase n=1 Tax=Cytobacillus eiseniae TaxID=762947 RepID=A0ABS4RK61_9BACI|nr:ATP-binding protein [Cytobacillus eiseniae]MBP2243295.1 two-component system sensor histidine kinase BaeS [Cytobacillus eiseniae]